MNAVVQISAHSMQQIGIANRLAEVRGDIEAQAKQEARYIASAMQDIVAGLQKNDQIAHDMGMEFLQKATPEEMGELFRIAFRGDGPALVVAMLQHGGKAVAVLGEIEGIKQAEEARYA